MRIALLCNDRIALPAIDQLLAARLVAAIGMPDKAGGIQPLIQAKCIQAGIPFQLFTRKDFTTSIVQWVEQYKPDAVLVKTFPYRIPAAALAIPRYGFINFHYAPLPRWRGANPLFWMIKQRETTGGISVHRMTEEYDAGPLLLQQPIPLSADINFGLYYTQLAFAGAQLTGILLNGLQTNTLVPVEQDHGQAQWYGRPSMSDLFIDWQQMDAEEIKALVNACNPWNRGAATRWNGWTFGISDATVVTTSQKENLPGTILHIDASNGFVISCKEGKAIRAEVVYCEEGFYPGHRLAFFGLQEGNRLS